ncbi:MAG: ATP-binding protein [Candidatus Woesearchaeota archaeon]
MEISELRKSNLWWIRKENIDDDFHLKQLNKQKIKWHYDLIKSFEIGVYSIRGPRQIGKTTYIKEIIKQLLEFVEPKNIFFYSCDNLYSHSHLLDLLETYLNFSDEKEKKYIFLDEVAFVPNWQLAIKHLYDQGKLQNCFVLITGSSSIDIRKSIEQLPGRRGIGKRHFIMFPLTFYEYVKAINSAYIRKISNNLEKDLKHIELYKNEIQKDFLDYCLCGGFLVAINDLHSNNRINEFTYEIYINWLIGDLAKWNKKERYVKQMLRRIIEVYTTEVSFNSLKSQTEIESHNTISEYIDCLGELFQLQFVYKLDWNKLIPDFPKNKKIYTIDPFIFHCLNKWVFGIDNNFDRSKENITTTIQSKIVEGILLNHIIKYLSDKSQTNLFDYKNKIFYWKNKAKTKEIDFVIKLDKLIGFEVKWQNQINNIDLKILNEFDNSIILSKSTHIKNKAIPISSFLLIMDKWIDCRL